MLAQSFYIYLSELVPWIFRHNFIDIILEVMLDDNQSILTTAVGLKAIKVHQSVGSIFLDIISPSLSREPKNDVKLRI
jgi:hypothetical protein